MPIYRQILKKALGLTWHNPSLLIFGAFTALISVGEINLLLTYIYNPTGRLNFLTSFFGDLFSGSFGNLYAGLMSTIQSHAGSFIIGIMVALIELAFTALILWLTIVSQAALINRIINLAQNKKTDLAQNFRLGLKKFWPILLVNLILQLGLWLLALLVAWINQITTGTPIIYPLVIIITLILVALIAFAAKLTILQVVLKDEKLIDSCKKSWQLFTKNWLICLEFAALLFAIIWITNQIVGSLFGVGIQLIVGPLYPFPKLILSLLLLLYLVFILVQILIVAFYWANWSLFFEYLYSKKFVASRMSLGLKKLLTKK
ncbi:MAG: hypothetical protein JW816_00385 [Candidatus Buchananbacteria bacterium]|nr:hypothetical protein [Candidatus Buchananbacteria bacterium]